MWGSHGDEVDPETAMRRMGFDDDTLVGKGLHNYEARNDRQKRMLEAARMFAAGEANRFGLFMAGAPGRGKTHLARGIALHCLLQGKGFRYKRIQDLVAECKKRMGPDSSETPEQHVSWLCDFNELLIIDELGRTRGGEWDTDCVIYPLVDRRKSKPTIFISNYSLEQLTEKYDEAITSRLQLCTVMAFPKEMEDYRKR